MSNFQRSALHRGIISTISVPMLAMTLASTAQAQDSGADDSIQEIVVTNRYSTNDRLDTATGLGLTLHETPQSVSVVTAERISDQNLRSLTDVIDNAAGVSARAQDSSRSTYSSRGFSINNYQIDGVPIYWQPFGLSQPGTKTRRQQSIYQHSGYVSGQLEQLHRHC